MVGQRKEKVAARPESIFLAPHAFFQDAVIWREDLELGNASTVPRGSNPVVAVSRIGGIPTDGVPRRQEEIDGSKTPAGDYIEPIDTHLQGLALGKHDGEREAPSGSDGNQGTEGLARKAETAGLACHICGESFSSLQEQRGHFKSDWHRLNLKRQLARRAPLSEEAFEALADRRGGSSQREDDDVSSVSGSEEESEEGEDHERQLAEDQLATAHNLWHRSPKLVFLLPSSGLRFAIWRVLVAGGKGEAADESAVLSRVRSLAGSGPAGDVSSGANDGSTAGSTGEERKQGGDDAGGAGGAVGEAGGGGRHPWVIILSAGGHFAAAVVDSAGGAVIAHQTFHRYVVRAKAGGRQSSKDATGRAPKSAGSSLRRHNEAALEKEVRELLASWRGHLAAASRLFVYAPSSNSRALFADGAGGAPSLLRRDDPRLQSIPFTVRRPTFKEVRRVAAALAAIDYKVDALLAPLPLPLAAAPATLTQPQVGAATGGARAEAYGTGHNDRRESEGAHAQGHGHRNVRRDAQANASSSALGRSQPSGYLFEPAGSVGEAEEARPEARESSGTTPLHEASAAGEPARVLVLLEGGEDPGVADARGRTPYAVAADKETRNVFRRYMATAGEQWDWHAAGVPSALSDELEAAQAAKKAEKSAKMRAREKERKAEKRALLKARQEKEEAEAAAAAAAATLAAAQKQVRYGTSGSAARGGGAKGKQQPNPEAVQKAMREAQAKEREMRAKAAEMRLQAVAVASGTSTSSRPAHGPVCDCCRCSLAGKTPFYRLQYKYCSTSCVGAHRLAMDEEGRS
eukprot:jgi/Mesen1/8135/ME000437S07227